jgi:hypothetical protein
MLICSLLVLAAMTAAAAAKAAAPPIHVITPGAELSTTQYQLFIAPPASEVGAYQPSIAFSSSAGQQEQLSLGELTTNGHAFTTLVPNTSERLVVTSGEVTSVTVNGGAPIPTAPAIGPPYDLRAALVKLLFPPPEPGATRTRNVVRVAAFGTGGAQIAETNEARVKPPALETRSWEPPAPPAQGICSIHAEPFAGLTVVSGAVLSVARPVQGVSGTPYVTCARTEYSYPNSPPLVAYMLLDGEHPAAPPAAIPVLEAIATRPGLFETNLIEGFVVARRLARAWLLVEGGRDATQRLSLLSDLRAQVALTTTRSGLLVRPIPKAEPRSRRKR